MKNPSWDPGNKYTMAWQSGWTAVGYNSSEITEPVTSVESLFDPKYRGKVGMMNDPQELNNLYGQPGHEAMTAMLKAELMRLKREVHDEDQLANEQLPDGVDGTVAILRSHPR